MNLNRTLHATYIGPRVGWNVEAGLGALVMLSPTKPDTLLAQFDDFWVRRAGKDLAFGWHEFPADQFKIDEDSGK